MSAKLKSLLSGKPNNSKRKRKHSFSVIYKQESGSSINKIIRMEDHKIFLPLWFNNRS